MVVRMSRRRCCEKGNRSAEDLTELVALYRTASCLWRQDAASYLDGKQRHQAYGMIHESVNIPGVVGLLDVMMKIREMRWIYVRELRRILEAGVTGRRYQTGVPWFYDLHEFLYPYLDYDEALQLHNIKETYNDESRNWKDNDSCCGDSREYDCFSSPTSNGDSCCFRAPTDQFSMSDRSSKFISVPIEHPSKTKALDKSPFTRGFATSTPCTSILEDKRDRSENANHDNEPVAVSHRYSSPSKSLSRDSLTGKESTERLLKINDCPPKEVNCSETFELFAESVAHQLRSMDLKTALEAQVEIQRILIEFADRANVTSVSCDYEGECNTDVTENKGRTASMERLPQEPLKLSHLESKVETRETMCRYWLAIRRYYRRTTENRLDPRSRRSRGLR